MEAGIVDYTILFPVLILIAICFLAIGYAATNVSLDITGTVSADKQEGIVITNVTESTSTEARGEIGYYIGYGQYALLNSTVTLSSSSSSSSITYTIEIINTNDISYYFDSVNIGDSSAYYTNDDIEYEISLTEGDEIEAGGTLTFTLTFSYADGVTPSSSNNTLTSYLQFIFTDVIEVEPNTPVLDDGMIPVYYDPSTCSWIICSTDDENWYDYDEKQWANVMMSDGKYTTTTGTVGTRVSKDELGSMFVWIPRYAYKIEQDNGSGGYKASSGVISVVWLRGTSNKYLNSSGTMNTATTTPILTSDGTEYTDYVVHPCFTNGNGSYDNGEWDDEISGFWISKFEGGSAMSTSDSLNSSLGIYDKTTAISIDDGQGTTTSYYYPMFKGQRYSYNYLTISYMYNMMQALNDSGNIYGMSSTTDSHLIKNSEWGAVTYLAYSKYGIGDGNGSFKTYNNNVSYGGTISSSYVQSGTTKAVYAVTGYASDLSTEAGSNTLTSSTALDETVTGSNSRVSYAWYSTEGTLNSTTGNIYGVYDMSGGQNEFTSSYVNYSTSNATFLVTYGSAFATGTSTKYVTAYQADDSVSNYSVNESYYLWTLANGYFGDGIYEISTRITLTSSGHGGLWNAYQEADTSSQEPFFIRGGEQNNTTAYGLLALADDGGKGISTCRGVRAVLIVE